jgi:nucleoside-diphosphate-sugar epimerase
MNILVTGGAGFLGSHLCKKLLDQGHHVICVDNLLTGKKENISSLLENGRFEFHELNVKDLHSLKDKQIGALYHLASPASPNADSPKSYHSLPFETMEVNTLGTQICAQFALDHNAKFLFASTSEIYGDPLEHPQKEDYRGNVSTTGPRAVYDEAKRFGETITSTFVREKNLDGRIIRIFNTYGPGMELADGRAVIEFATQALANEPLEIFGDGSQTRSFCYVDDLIEGIIKAMDSEGTKGQVFNLGNPGERTILDLAKLIIRLSNSKSELIYKPLPEDDPMRRRPDISKAIEKLDWEPKVGLEEGLGKLIQFLKNNSTV